MSAPPHPSCSNCAARPECDEAQLAPCEFWEDQDVVAALRRHRRPRPTSRPIDTALALRAQQDMERTPWPAWLGTAEHHLIDLEQMAALAPGDNARELEAALLALRATLAAVDAAAEKLMRELREGPC